MNHPALRAAYNMKTFLERARFTLGIIPAGFRGELMVGRAQLSAVKFGADGSIYDYGVIGRRKVNQQSVKHFCNMLSRANLTDVSMLGIILYKYHGSGTGVGADANTDYILGTEVTDNVRSTGTNTDQSIGASITGVFQSVGTIAYTGSHAITEHGLFGGTDRNNTTVNGAQAANTTPLLVASTTGFAASGNVWCLGQALAYTSVDATHFIGCTQGNANVTLAASAGITAAPLFDRTGNFAAINVLNGDSIQFSYQLTINPEA